MGDRPAARPPGGLAHSATQMSVCGVRRWCAGRAEKVFTVAHLVGVHQRRVATRSGGTVGEHWRLVEHTCGRGRGLPDDTHRRQPWRTRGQHSQREPGNTMPSMLSLAHLWRGAPAGQKAQCGGAGRAGAGQQCARVTRGATDAARAMLCAHTRAVCNRQEGRDITDMSASPPNVAWAHGKSAPSMRISSVYVPVSSSCGQPRHMTPFHGLQLCEGHDTHSPCEWQKSVTV